MLRRSCSII